MLVALVADLDHLVFRDQLVRDSAETEWDVPRPGCDHLGLTLKGDCKRLENETGRTAGLEQRWSRGERDGYVSGHGICRSAPESRPNSSGDRADTHDGSGSPNMSSVREMGTTSIETDMASW